MQLNLFERIVLQQILPVEGSYATLKIVSDLRMALAPSEEEFKEYAIVEESNKVSWNEKGKVSKDIPVGDKAKDVVRKTLKRLDELGKLEDKHVSLYEKFCKDEVV